MTKKAYILSYTLYGDYMKKFRYKKKRKYKYIVLILFIVLLFNNKFILNGSYKNIINFIFKNDINYKYQNNVFNNLYSTINKNLFNNPVNILHTLKNEDSVVLVNNAFYSENNPKIYIYNSHQGEKYSHEYLDGSNIVPDVMLASSMLKEKLENIGIKTIVETNDILGYMNKHGLNHVGSYIASRVYLGEVYKKYPNLDLYIDLHRDSVEHDSSTTIINGKKFARVLFVIGLENKNYQKNLNVTNKINNLIIKKYPSLTRGIMKKQGPNVNGVYNQDLDGNIILLELGGYKNNIDEISNTLDILAEIIKEYINEKEKV